MWHQPVLVCLVLLIQGVFSRKYEVGDSCLDERTGSSGHCTTPDSCETGEEDYFLTKKRPTPCDTSRDNFLVCCRDRFATNGEKAHEKRVGDIATKKCKQYSKSVVKVVSYITLDLYPTERTLTGSECNYTGVQLIIGGVKAKQGEFPHMAAIGWTDYVKGYKFDCGGALISERFVLTAAHCTSSRERTAPVIVRLGEQNLNPDVYDRAHPVDIPIKRIINHPDYKASKRYNDISLLELETDAVFSESIRPACLWLEPDSGNHSTAIATGWGIINSTTQEKSDELLKVSLSILDNKDCNKTLSFKINRKWPKGFIDSQMCAGETRQGKDTCQGDSGSPLQVVSDENECIFKVMGIVSFGASVCGNYPAVYTRVSSYIGWIESVVWPDE